MPVHTVRHNVAAVRSYSSAGSEVSYREPLVARRPLYVDDYDLQDEYDAVDNDLEATTNYIEEVRVVPRRKFSQYQTNPRFARIPVRNRISFPVWRNRFAGSFMRKINIDRPRPFGSLRYASRNTRFIRNGFSNTFWRSRNMMPQGRSFLARRGRFAGDTSTNRFNRTRRPAVTKEELDKELDEYMKKGKHPQIDVSDLN